MSTKTELLSLLSENPGAFYSGQEIAERLGISRNSIWKAANSLKEQGFEVESRAGVGYRLAADRDIISRDVLASEIAHPCNIHVFEKIDSTNNYAKGLDVSGGLHLIIASEQTAGRGRLGRSFYSPAEKGIYMSLAFEPHFDLDKSLFVTTLSAVAMCRAIEEVTGLSPKIKWVNDIYLNGKKLSGILTEAESNFETGMIQKIIVGIGVNCFSCDMPEEIQEVATCIEAGRAARPEVGGASRPGAAAAATEEAGADATCSESGGSGFSRNALIAAFCNQFFDMIENFDQKAILRDYKRRSFIIGEQILIYNPAIAREIGRSDEHLHDGIRARAIDIDENGGLVVEFLEGRLSREMRTLTSGEITVRKI